MSVLAGTDTRPALIRRWQPRAYETAERGGTLTTGSNVVRQALARGDVLLAYDGAMAALDADPHDLEIAYLAALALARSGSTSRAEDAAARLKDRIWQAPQSAELRQDVDALQARLGKDRAFRLHGPARTLALIDAARRYETVDEVHGGYYSCVNAATLWLLAGDLPRARHLAERARARVADEARSDEEHAYWASATAAEASLILDDIEAADAYIETASSLSVHRHANRATTRRQLELVCHARHHSLAILRPLEPPGVVHYCGNRLLSRSRKLGATSEDRIAEEAGRYLDSLGIGFAYGALASGADITIAEQVLARDLELHVVLPFAVDEFLAESVSPAGEEWCTRFSTCLEAASSVSITSDSRYDGDDVLYDYGSKIAMGHAINRASFLGADAVQIAAWDGNPGAEKAGTAHDVAVWTRAGWRSYTIRTAKRRASNPGGEPSASMRRTIAAVLFADFHGFSRLRDEQFPAFVHSVLGKLAAVLDEDAARVQWRRSWGDAIQVVFDDIAAAARCALRLQSVVDALVWDDLRLPADLRLRIGAHAGPVLQLFDPVTSETGWWGREITRAARIEPRTPEGAVYVSDAFAALLALEPDSGLATEYVGRITTAKAFETVPMHHLRPTDPSRTFGWRRGFDPST